MNIDSMCELQPRTKAKRENLATPILLVGVYKDNVEYVTPDGSTMFCNRRYATRYWKVEDAPQFWIYTM